MAETYQSAAVSLRDPEALRRASVISRMDGFVWTHADPLIKQFAQKLQNELRSQQVPMIVSECYRSRSDQQKALAAGRSRAKPGLSPHQYGLAVDVVHAVRGWELTRKEWGIVGALGKEQARRMGLKVTWGGDFKSLYDPAHWELEDWKNRALVLMYERQSAA